MAGREVSLPAILPVSVRMNHYQQMKEAARRRFLTYDPGVYREKPGVIRGDNEIFTPFLGQMARISQKTGEITFPTGKADFGAALCLYDWLCDGQPAAVPGGEFCPVSSLPGVWVRGSGLTMDTRGLAAGIEEDPAAFRRACESLGGTGVALGDLGFRIPVFADMSMVVKFYHGDGEFPPSCVLLWDRNILQYIRYETVYYLAGCLLRRLEEEMGGGYPCPCPQ